MKDRQKLIWSNFFAIVAVLSLFILSIFNFLEQKDYFADLMREKNLLQLRRQTAILQEGSKPQNLLRQLFFSRLKEVGEISHARREQLEKSLGSCLGSDSIALFLDSNQEVVYAQNLDKENHQPHKEFLQLYFEHAKGKLTRDGESKAGQTSRQVFRKSFYIKHFPNLQNFGPAKHHKNPGWLFIGIIPSTRHMKSIRQFSIGLSEAELLRSNNLGMYLIFVPEATTLNELWYKNSIQKAETNKKQKHFVGTETEIKRYFKTIGKFKEERLFLQALAEKPYGSFISGNKGFCFTELPSFSSSERKLYLIATIKLEQLSDFRTEKAYVFLQLIGTVLLLLTIIRLSHPRHVWNWSIAAKFITVSVVSVLFPLAGMLYQESIRSSLEEFVAEQKVFTELEKRFVAIENEIEIKLSDIFSCLEMFKETYAKNASDNRQEFLQDLEIIRDRRIYHVAACEPGGKVKLMDTDTGNTSKMSDELKKILDGIVRFNITNLNLKQLIDPEDQKHLQNSLIIETLTEGFKPIELFKNSMETRTLQPIKSGQESVWVITDFDYDENHSPNRFYMMMLDRNRIIRESINNFQMNFAKVFPEMVFFIKLGSYPSIAPSWGEDKPILMNLMEIAGTEGEVVKQVIANEKEKVFIFGRRIKNQEWAALSLHKQSLSDTSKAGISRATIFAAVYILALLLILTFYFRNFFSKPVETMNFAVKSIAEGNYHLQLPDCDDDELGKLNDSFKQMAKELEEKEYLSRFLSNLAKEAISGDRSISGTRIKATVLFSDIRSFTTLTEKHSPDDIVEMLNDYMTAMETVIEKHRGSIEMFIGDAIMAVFLPELGQALPAQRATLAAIDMGQALAEFNKSRAAAGKFQINNGVGIATGELLMGSMGNLQSQQRYTVTGKTVNLAAEMEKLSKQAKHLPIVICPTTANQIKLANFRIYRLEVSNISEAFALRPL